MEKKGLIGKQELRSRYLYERDGISIKDRKEKSAEIWRLLKEEPVYQNAGVVLVYMDYRSEVMTTGLVEELFANGKKRIFAPKVEGMVIRFYEVMGMDDFSEGYQGIREPSKSPDRLFTREISKGEKTLVLVPGAVFDRERGRMGYGKGFYDRYLAAFPEITSAALAFSCQIAKKVPIEPHDMKPDIIVTEKGIIR